MTYHYTVFSLVISFPFPCPFLQLIPVTDEPDIEVIEGSVPRILENSVLSDQNWQAAPGRFLLRGGRRVGRFLVLNGNRITIQRSPHAEDELLWAILLNSVLAALLHQRGLLVLHANVIVTPRGVVAISGDPGAGKSTTIATLIKQGCLMVTDDLTALQLSPENQIIALPGLPKMNLCEDAALRLGYDSKNLQRSPIFGNKFIIPVTHDCMEARPVVLNTIYLLQTYSGNQLRLTSLSGVEKFAALQDCIYGPQFVEELPDLFKFSSILIDQVNIVRLERPSNGITIDKVIGTILHG